jgi:hypothetical protein
MTPRQADHRCPRLAQTDGLIEAAVLKQDPACQIGALEVERSRYTRTPQSQHADIHCRISEQITQESCPHCAFWAPASAAGRIVAPRISFPQIDQRAGSLKQTPLGPRRPPVL